MTKKGNPYRLFAVACKGSLEELYIYVIRLINYIICTQKYQIKSGLKP